MSRAPAPVVALQAATRRYRLAVEVCPHWDCENDTHDELRHECCRELDAAQRELTKARRVVREAEQPALLRRQAG